MEVESIEGYKNIESIGILFPVFNNNNGSVLMKDSDWFLISAALLLGIRHGFDLDHLATIDAITRSVRNKPSLSRMVGFLFSLGHGLVVIIVSLIIGGGIISSSTPEWLNGVGNIVSITCLFLFGFLTLWNTVNYSSPATIPTNFRNYLSQKFVHHNIHPLLILFIGALFALSFDTISQIVLFSLSASALSGFLFSGLLGFIFMMGMMMSDGLNGVFVASLIRRADGVSLFFSRLIGFGIAFFSIGIAIINCCELL
ncbi:TPA: DNA repair protein [Legionella pneumophila]|nr:DNA repair protein [Legionella pneumophila subsp. pascullei]HAT6917232.1 DNA repair protein [Legionella pneumophila]HAT6919675.1 DNA repair protein [Legionella pneumophila]HAT6972315.1 DNA repair protein [Legionella pneumophila]HAU3861485.1 DNA repair protein [Legionella pneumophila]